MVQKVCIKNVKYECLVGCSDSVVCMGIYSEVRVIDLKSKFYHYPAA